MRCLACFATTEGHTDKVAKFVTSSLEEAGYDVQSPNLNSAVTATDPTDRERVIPTGSVHEDRHQEMIAKVRALPEHAMDLSDEDQETTDWAALRAEASIFVGE